MKVNLEDLPFTNADCSREIILGRMVASLPFRIAEMILEKKLQRLIGLYSEMSVAFDFLGIRATKVEVMVQKSILRILY